MAAFWVGHGLWESCEDWRDVHCRSGPDRVSDVSTAHHFSQAIESGAFAYQQGVDYGELCRQRLVLWSCVGNTLQLVERSMQNNLVGGAVRLHLPSQCLPGVQVHELGERHVLVACASAESVHCLLLPHPVDLWQTSGARGEGEGRPSILQCLTQDSLPRVMVSQPIYGERLLCASVANSGQVLFSLPSKSGSILLIQLPLRAEGVGFHFEHHLSGVMQRLWSGLTRAGDAHQGEGLVLHSTQHSVTMALVTSELKLQCWGIKNQQAHLELTVPLAHLNLNLAQLQRVKVAKGVDPVISDNFAIIVYYELAQSRYVCVCQLARDNSSQLTADVMATVPVQRLAVADMALCGSDLWLLGGVAGSCEVVRADLHTMKQTRTLLWEDRAGEVAIPSGTTVQEAYVAALFSRAELPPSVIVEALRQMGHEPRGGAGQVRTGEWLKQQTILAMEEEVQLAASFGELSVEDFALLEHRCWGSLYQHCLRARAQTRGQASLFVDSGTRAAAVVSAGNICYMVPALAWSPPLLSNQEVVLGWVEHIKDLVPEGLLQEVLAECSGRGPQMEEFVQSLLSQEGRALLQGVDHIADLASCLEGLADTLEGGGLVEDKKGDELAVAGQVGSSFAAGLMASLLHSASKERVGLGVALLAVMGLLRHAEPDSMDAELSSGLCGLALHESSLSSRVSSLVVLHCTLVWLARTPPVPCPPSLFERTLQLAKTLGLPASRKASSCQGASLAELLFTWLPMAGKRTVEDMFRAFLSDIWPGRGGSVTTALGLLLHGQFSHVEHYCGMVMPCLDKGIHSMQLVKGLAHMSQGDFPGAVQNFTSAAGGVGDRHEPHFQPSMTLEAYYSQVVQALGNVGATHSAVAVLKEAVRRSDPTLPTTSVLWSLLFKHQTQLGHFHSAYSTMLAIPDRRRQLDSLRYLITVLLDKGQANILCGLSFRQLEPDAGRLLEMRARGADLLSTNTYPTLFSYCILRKNYRKGAAAMFEWACRIGQELQGLPALRQQTSCLAAVLSCLQLVDVGGAWVVRPGDPCTVVDLQGVSREYVLARCRLGLAKHCPSLSEPVHYPPRDASETLPALVKACQYQTALRLAVAFRLPCSSVLEGVASQCVHSHGSLPEPDVGGTRTLVTRSSATGGHWSFLRTIFNHCPPGELPECLRVVSHKLLSNSVALPQWLVELFQATDAVALLKVLLSFDLLQLATEVALHSMDQSRHSLDLVSHTSSLKHCLPRFCLEHLLHRLQSSCHPDWRENYEKLQLKYERTFL